MNEEGSYPVVSAIRDAKDCGLIVLHIDGTTTPLTLSDGANVGLLQYDAEGTLETVPLLELAQSCYSEAEAVSFRADEAVSLGAILCGSDGKMTGMVMAAQGEGKSRYVALTAVSIYDFLTDETRFTMGVQAGAPVVSVPAVTYSLEEGWLTIDLSGLNERDVAHRVYFIDYENPYYSVFTVDAGADHCSIPVVPGRNLLIYVMTADQMPDFMSDLPDLLVAVPEAQAYTLYDYQDGGTFMTLLPTTNEYGDTDLLPEEAITREKLLDGEHSLYMMSSSLYQVEEEISGCLLVAAMTTPDGLCFWDYGSFTFAPEYMPVDQWHWNLTELFSDYLKYTEGTAAAGTYTFAFYIDGALAGTAEFTLE